MTAKVRPMSVAAKKPKRRPAAIAGWREHVHLPELGAGPLIAKLDSGALSASLHAENIQAYDKAGSAWVRFDVPADNERVKARCCDMPLHGERRVKNTGGTSESRFVIETEIRLGDEQWQAQVTLSDRTDMGVPMLLGRATIRGRFLVNPARSFLHSTNKRVKKVKPS